jgi:PIN domain nuclease of toxin-antitoxin system
VRLLLDTHVLLWFASGDTALTVKAREQVLDPNNEILLSHASAWELAIKTGLGKLRLDRALPVWLERYVIGNGFAHLPITLAHILHTATLPQHHGDPFDRLLVAQCDAERLTLVSRDPVFDTYGVKRLW